MNDAGVLVIGYGSTLRSDDGFGCCAARRLAADPRLAGAEVLARHQLTPELAADIARATLVVLVDSSAGGDPGAVSVAPVHPRPAAPASWSHHLAPEALAGLAEALYGAVPPMVLVRVAAASLAEGERLSGVVERALPAVVEAVAGLVTGHRLTRSVPGPGPRSGSRSAGSGGRGRPR